MKKYIRIILLGILSWFIPFVVSFFFYSKEGNLVIDISLFKSIMIVVGGACGAILLIYHYRMIRSKYIFEGIITGLIWLALNLILDLITIVPMSKMVIGVYFSQIGLRYLLISIMSISMGYVATNVNKHTT